MFCLKCRRKVTVDDDGVSEGTVNGRRVLRASCPTCRSNISRFVRAVTP
ncbi:MAG: DUF5679 domain-containing protein [Candidatus Bathyarchaeia archaeon]